MIKKTLLFLAIYACTVLLLISSNIIWMSPGYYEVKNRVGLKIPIVDMAAYAEDSSHRRPYIYSINAPSGGAVYVLGIEHLNDSNHPQLDSIRMAWKKAKPTLTLVEGRLGFLFTWFQDPVEAFGENGLAAYLARRDDAMLFTWEPTRDDEIEILLSDFSPEQLAIFYTLRPYFSNMRFGKPENPEKKLQEYLNSRTDYQHIRDIYTSWEEIDAKWQEDFPEVAWRTFSDKFGWPAGYFNEIANKSNLARDEHLVQIIIEAVNNGEIVFAIVGASHAPRIEQTLIEALGGLPE